MAVYKIVNRLINVLFLILISITILGAISFIPADFQGLSHSFLKILISLLFIYFAVLYTKNKRQEFFQSLVKRIKGLMSYKAFWITLSIVLILWQISTVFYLSGLSGWDWRIITSQARGVTIPEWSQNWPSYFSLFPNNLLLLKLENIYWIILGHPKLSTFVYLLNLANLFLVDLATFFIWKTSNKIMSKKASKFVLFATLTIFTLLPFFVIPYSDTLSFFLTSLIIYTLTFWKESNKEKNKYIWSVLLGVEFSLAYFIKPSLIIIMIALVVVFIKSFRKFSVALGVIIVAFMAVTMVVKPILYKHNGLVQVDTTRTIPMSHFIAMGMHGSGGFDTEDYIQSATTKNPQKRNNQSLSLIKKRFKTEGISGYLQFLVQKQINNSSEGVFGWGKEGNFLTVFGVDNKIKRFSFQRHYFVDNHGQATDKLFNFRFVQQIIWLVILIFILLSFKDYSIMSLTLKTAAVGFFSFLLIFEGGRSRYIIQFLPILLLLAGLGWQQMASIFKSSEMKHG